MLARPRGDKRNVKHFFSSSAVATTTEAAVRGLLALLPTRSSGEKVQEGQTFSNTVIH